MKCTRAVQTLTQALSNDSSPAVRESAARGLGLLGDASALAALQRAAQTDVDRDVRHSASFSAEILRSNLRGR
jgi:HEAT repeat protein